MNRLVKATMNLATAQRDLGALLDTPAEQRAEDFDAKLTTAKATVTEAHNAVEVAALVEPDVPEHREDSAGGRELRALLDSANVGDAFDRILAHSAPTGPMAELQAHMGLAPNMIPLALLETRAVTPAPGNVGQNQQPIIPYVFPESAAAFLGVDMPTVGVGEAVFPVLTSELSVGTPAEHADQAETTGAFSAEVLSPSRIQASFFYSREDRARFAGMDSALRENLSDGLSDGLDKQIMAGTNGLLTGTVLANHTQAAATTFDQYIADFAFGRVDGRFASTTAAIRAVMGGDTYADCGSTYRNTSVDRTALDRLMELTGGVRVSAHVPDKASDKQNAVIRLGSRRDMVAPIWEGIAIIPDEITKAASGGIIITAVMLHAVKLLRSAGFYKQEVNLS